MYAFCSCSVRTALGNGFIEGRELDDFLREFVSSVSLTDVGPEVSKLLLLLLKNVKVTVHRCDQNRSLVALLVTLYSCEYSPVLL